MAQATITITYDDVLSQQDVGQHSQWMYGTITVNAGTYATGGIGTAVASSNIVWGVADFPKVRNQVPKDVYFYSAGLSGTTVGGYAYLWNKANNSFQIGAAATVTAGTGPQQEEMTNGTSVPAAITGDTIRFEARFNKAEL